MVRANGLKSSYAWRGKWVSRPIFPCYIPVELGSMSAGLVLCLGCQMWEFWETSSLADGHICARCTEMQLLRDRVRDLELQPDDLLLIKESEEVIDRSYREVVIPRLQGSENWVTVRRGKGNARIVESTPVAAPLSNKYMVLDATEGDDLTEDDHGDRVSVTEPGTVVQEGRREKRNAVVIRDSIVRGTDRRFCEPDRDTCMVCCLPGARVQDVSGQVRNILKGKGEHPAVLVHDGTNDIDRKRKEVLKRDFRELGRKLRSRTSRVVISGLLPVPRASEGKNSRIRQMNAWLRDWCRGQGFRFLDHWDLFWGKYDLLKKDGLHLNTKGTNILAGRFNRAVRECLN
ncbi:uncharacterized protein LOC132391883 [Hypanus sabinus]|uniref:uncharacterized protein LOC132391883 n=1 Tax=Hypanus sabinus TaxID=79690 RepID=UPI0028C41EA0|nr:uncharacterized protein LOC132391883 [Hypanus sabinus]